MKKLIFLLIVLIAAGLTAINAQDTWTPKADFGGGIRESAAGFSIGGKGYVGTGWNGTSQAKDFWEYDSATDTWTRKADFPGTARSSDVGFSIGNKGYIGGGSSDYYGPYFNDFWEYDPATDEWTRIADFPGVARFMATGFSIGNKGYYGTGATTSSGDVFYSDFWEYDPATDQWTRKADYGGGGRSNPGSFSMGNKGYIGCGFNWDYGMWTKDFWEYDPATDAWTRKADFGGDVREYINEAGFSIGNKGYLGSGYGSFAEYKDFWEYDPATNAWTQKADLGGAARVRAVGFSIGNKGYIGTGSSSSGDLKDFWEYTPETTTACTVPTGLTTANITGTSAKLKWNAVEEVPGYAVCYKVTGTQTWTYKMATTSAKNITGLLPNTSYTWSVKTFCSVDHPGVSSKWASVQTFTTGALKLADEQSTTLNVYPNPTSGQFKIAITLGDEETSSAMIQVINALGQIVYNEKTSLANGMLLQEINLKDLPAGMYLVKVIINDQVYSAPLNYSK